MRNYHRQTVRHGRASGWRWHKCRCQACHRALLAEARITWAARRLRRGANPASHVPALPVRKRVAELEQAGMSRRQIARAAGIAPATVSRIVTPSTKHCSRIVAGAVLGIPMS